MTTQILTPTDGAFVALVNHCIFCLGCKVDMDRPADPPKCPEAEALYRSWFILWRREARR
jgi:hypothetical protein